MIALYLIALGRLQMCEVPQPRAIAPDTARVRVQYIAVNRLDMFGFRGMAFAKRRLPLIVGAEAMGTVDEVGSEKDSYLLNRRVMIYPGVICGNCESCVSGKENLCLQPGGIMGFHVDGVAAEWVVVPTRQLLLVPSDVRSDHAACGSLTFGTVEHMLFENARLLSKHTVLIHAAGSGIGSTAIRLAKAAGAVVIATVGSDHKVPLATQIGADHVINYSSDRFEREVRRLTGRRGVDVVFEHVGSTTWKGSLLSLCRGGCLVTCGSTSGVVAETNLLHLFNQQIRIIASFGGNYGNVARAVGKMARMECTPIIDSVMPFSNFEQALEKLQSRQVFGKVLLSVPEAARADAR
jgi:alcohol dehydrogenase